MRKSSLIMAACGILFVVTAVAQEEHRIGVPEVTNPIARKVVIVPDIMGLTTLKCDFHAHTIFSDGVVKPMARVIEAWANGLDALAVTDHLEDDPDEEVLKGDDNTSYELALPVAQQYNLLLVKGAEITRDQPEGHHCALFIKDAKPLDVKDMMKAVEEAVKQGAFIQWNHPGWNVDKMPPLDIQEDLFKRGWLHGVEVFNDTEWYPPALKWGLEKNLALMANTDVHGLTAASYDLVKGQRPMTLVFARNRTLEALREAMFKGQTAAWFGEHLAGKGEYLEAIFKAAVSATAPHAKDEKGRVYTEVTNRSDILFVVKGTDGTLGETLRLAPRTTMLVQLQKDVKEAPVQVTNLHTNQNETLTTMLSVP